MLPVQELLARLGGKFVLHLEGKRGAAPRHQSMDRAIDWSYSLLSSEEQMAFRRLAVFPGDCSVASAQIVIEGGDWERQGTSPAAPLPILSNLVEKGLLVSVAGAGGNARFHLLAVIREFALAALEEAGESQLAARDHARFFRGFAELAAVELSGPDQAAWLDRIEADLANLRAAMRWSATHDPVSGLAIAAGLWRFWIVRSQVSEGLDWLERLLAVEEVAEPGSRSLPAACAADLSLSLGNVRGAKLWAEEALASSGDSTDPRQQALALAVAGKIAFRLNDLDRGNELLERASALSRDLPDAGTSAFCLAGLATLAAIRDEPERSESLQAECLAIYRRLGDKWGIVEALTALGTRARNQADFPRARAHHEEQLALSRELGSRSGIALSLNLLGWAAREERHFDQAEELYEESLALGREAGNMWRVAGVLNGLGIVAWRQGNLDRARSLLEESLAIRRQIGNAQWIAYAQQNLGDILRSGGDLAGAAACYRDALLLLSEKHAQKWDIAEALRRMGGLAGVSGRAEAGARLLGAAASLRESAGSPLPPQDQEDLERDLARIQAALGETFFESAQGEGRAMSLEEAIDAGLGI